MAELAEWSNFYVIVGSSAGALVGLQFVVVTLISDMARGRVDAQAGDAFATPSVVHFGVVLLLSALVAAPWQTMDVVAAFWGLVGLAGMVYCAVVVRRMRSQTAYKPVFEDWLFHVLLPIAAYTSLAASAIVVQSHPRTSLYIVGCSALVFLFVGIHNAWDAVTYHVLVRRRETRENLPPR